MTLELVSEDHKNKCFDELLTLLAKAEVKGEITMIDAVIIKDAFLLGKDKVGTVTNWKI